MTIILELSKPLTDKEIEIKFWPNNANITMNLKDKWCIQLTNDRIKFNREDFPNWEADDFAKHFMYILETKFNVKFYECEGKTDFEIRGETI